MTRKKKTDVAVETEFGSNDDDFNLDSFGVEAPLKERLESLAESGLRPHEVNEEIRERYVRYLERLEKEEKEGKNAER